MASVGAAAAAGLESGLGMGLRMRQQAQAEEQTKRANLVADQQLERQRAQDKRLEDDAALAAIEKQFEDLRAEGEGYFAQYGKAVPEDIAGPYKQRVGEVSGVRNTLLRKRYEPILKQHEQRAKDLVMRLEAGDVSLDNVPPGELFSAVRVQSRRDPADFLPQGKQPSRVSTAAKDFFDGVQYGNEGAVLRGANVLLEPELKVGIGEPSPYGGTIVGKQIVRLVPHPADPGKVLPVLKVYVRRAGKTAADVANAERVAEEGAPPGATGYYIAPITENRSSDPDDPPKAIDIDQAMEYFAKLQTMSSALAPMADRYKKGADDSFERAFYAVRGKMPAKAPVEFKNVPRGGLLAGFDTKTGQPTGQVVRGPEVETKATGLAGQIQAVQDYAAEQGISEAEAAVQLQQQGLLRPAKGGKGGGAGAGGAGGGLRASGVGGDRTGEEFLATLAPEDQKIVKGLAEGTIKPESISTKGNRREHMLALAAQYMPDGGGGGKPLPEPVRKVLVEARENAATMSRMINEFKPAYAGKGVLGVGADLQLDASSRLGVDNPSVQWWKNYRKMAQLVERHSMFGASLTVGEQAAWNSADINPGQDASVIEENLKTRAELAQKVLSFTRQDLIDAGHSEKRIGAIADRGTAPPPDTNQRKSGEGAGPAGAAAAPAAPAAAPFRLPTDRKKAAEAYAKMPSGTVFIAPDGTTRRKP